MSEIKPLVWDPVSRDYLEHRPGYPDSYFRLLGHLGIGLPGQRILDLGTGTGALSVAFASQGAHVTGVDLSEGQLQAGCEAAQKAGVHVEFKLAPAEETGLPDHRFDVISASMCWGYFDEQRMVAEVLRLLRPGGLLLLSTLIWAGAEDPIASQTDQLVVKYNPAAGQLERGGDTEIIPAWSRNRFRLKSYHDYKVDLPFTQESWRGRMRATKWIGAALPARQTAAFDREHQELLERIAPAQFSIRHRIRIQIFEPNPS